MPSKPSQVSDIKDRVTVIVINWNGKIFLRKCLDALRSQSYKYFSTVVVDNGSKDGSVDFINQHFPEVKTISLRENAGFSGANNIALETIETEFVALLNNDGVAHPLWLQELVEALDRFPAAGFAASKMVYYDDPDTIDRAGDAYTIAGVGALRGRGACAQSYGREEWIFGASAGAALYRMKMLSDVGIFDEDYFLLYEDVDLSFRAQLRGYRCLYVPDAVVYHMATRSIGYDSEKSVYYGHRNMEWTYIKNMPKKLIPRTIVLHLGYIVIAFFFFLLKGKGPVYLKAKIDALKGIKRAVQKRKQVQASQKVDNRYIRQLLEPERYASRYTRRLRQEK